MLSNKLNITCYFYFHRCCNLCWRLKLPIPVVQYATVLESLQEGSFFVNRTEFDFGTTHPNDFQWFKKSVLILYSIIDRRMIDSLTKSMKWKSGRSKNEITGRRKEQLSCSKLKLQFLNDSVVERSCSQSELLGWLRMKKTRAYVLSTKLKFYW